MIKMESFKLPIIELKGYICKLSENTNKIPAYIRTLLPKRTC